VLGGRRDLRLPIRIEVSDAEQADPRHQQLLLRREQRRELDIAGVRLDLDHRLADALQFDEAEILDREGNGVVVGIGVAERSKKFGAVRKHPLSVRGSQHRQRFHRTLHRPAPLSADRPRPRTIAGIVFKRGKWLKLYSKKSEQQHGEAG
jgi:hypothetical protein